MKKNQKLAIIGGIGASSAIVIGGAVATGIVLSQQNSKTNNTNDQLTTFNPSTTEGVGSTTNTQTPDIQTTPTTPSTPSTPSTPTTPNKPSNLNPQDKYFTTPYGNEALLRVKEINSVEGKYELTISEPQSSEKYGQIVFVDKDGKELGTTVKANAGDELSVKCKILNDEYTLLDLRVYSEGNKNNQLGIVRKDDIYSFVLPEEKIEGPFGEMIDNPFYKGTKLVVESVYGKARLNGWEYDFDTRTYSYYVNDDNFILDDLTNKDLVMVEGKEGELTQYRVYLNNHDVVIKNLTVPKNTQLMFINNKTNSNEEGKVPTISRFVQKDCLIVKGAVGRWGSVKYSNDLSDYLGVRRD